MQYACGALGPHTRICALSLDPLESGKARVAAHGVNPWLTDPLECS